MTDAILIALMALSAAATYLLLKSGFRAPPAAAVQPPAQAYQPPSPGEPAAHWRDAGRLQTEVVAESRYKATVQELAGPHGDAGADTRLTAVLAVDHDNPYDDKPVTVFVAGRMVGYLQLKDAQQFRAQLARQELEGQAVSCDAAIRGGVLWDGKRLAYAVWLDLDLAQ